MHFIQDFFPWGGGGGHALENRCSEMHSGGFLTLYDYNLNDLIFGCVSHYIILFSKFFGGGGGCMKLR